jgi:hypothetical protein
LPYLDGDIPNGRAGLGSPHGLVLCLYLPLAEQPCLIVYAHRLPISGSGEKMQGVDIISSGPGIYYLRELSILLLT